MDAASRTNNAATAVADDSFAAREDSFDASVHSVDLTSAGVEDMDVAAGKWTAWNELGYVKMNCMKWTMWLFGIDLLGCYYN